MHELPVESPPHLLCRVQVTGLAPAGDVDPEQVVALGAAVHAGVMQVRLGS